MPAERTDITLTYLRFGAVSTFTSGNTPGGDEANARFRDRVRKL